MTLPRKIVGYMIKNGGSISAREAFLDLDITSSSLTRRICDLEEMGYQIIRERKKHPVTGKLYTRYRLKDTIEGSKADTHYASVKHMVTRYGLKAA